MRDLKRIVLSVFAVLVVGGGTGIALAQSSGAEKSSSDSNNTVQSVTNSGNGGAGGAGGTAGDNNRGVGGNGGSAGPCGGGGGGGGGVASGGGGGGGGGCFNSATPHATGTVTHFRTFRRVRVFRAQRRVFVVRRAAFGG